MQTVKKTTIKPLNIPLEEFNVYLLKHKGGKMGNKEEYIEAQDILKILLEQKEFSNKTASRILSKAYNMLLKERKKVI